MNLKMTLKKFVSCVLIFIFTFAVNFIFLKVFAVGNYEKTKNSIKIKGELVVDDLPAKSYILADYKTGQVLYEKNADEKLSIASITKIMTMLLVVEAIENKKLSLNDMVVVTKNAKSSVEEASLWLAVGEKISVKDLLKAVAISSCNDAARILAEHIAGSEKKFVELMNKRAKEIGMKNTNFCNASGLDDKKQYSTARDVAKLAKEILKYAWITNYTSRVKEKFKNSKFVLSNTNLLLQSYRGCNGLKTGTTKMAGNCLCATATRNNIFLCAVSLGSKTNKERLQTCTSLLDYGFKNFKATGDKLKKVKKA